MKFKRMISFVLSLGIIISTLTGITAVSAADIAEAVLPDVAVNGNFNEELAETWALSSSAEGVLKIETDSKDPSNKVLRYDGTTNSKSISYINYTGAEPNKTYYMTLKVRMADVESNTKDMYIYANSLSSIGKTYYNATRPQVTKDGWAVCSGVVTTSSDSKNIGFKAVTAQTGSNINYPDAVYEIDDFALYDMEGYYKLTLPSDVTITSGVFTCNGVNYAKAGDTVVLDYKPLSNILAADTTTVTKDGSAYTFVMPGAETTVTLANPPAFTNLVANGDMEDESNVRWNKGSNAADAEISIVADTKDANNKVLRFNGTGITSTSNPMSYMAYADKFAAGSYYYSYKIRLAESDKNTNTMYIYNSQHSGKNDMDSPALSKDQWVTRSGVFKTTGETSVNFKVVSDRTAPTASASNVPAVIYEIDDVVMYNMADIYEITLPDNVTIVEGGKELAVTNSSFEQATKYYAEAGEAIKIEYKGDKRLSIVGTEVTKAGDNYIFTMPAAAVTVNMVEPPFVNLIANGDMEGDVNNWKASSSVTGAVVSLVADSKDAANHVLRYDGTKITSGSTSYMGYSNVLTEGQKYYYSYKIRMAEDDTNEGDLYPYNQNHTEKNNMDRPKLSTDWVSRSGFFTAKATSYNFKITTSQTDSGKNAAKAIYELDDVVIYEVGYMNEVVLPEDTEVVSGVYALAFTDSNLDTVTKYYAAQEKEVTLKHTGERSLSVAGISMKKAGNIYTFVMPAKAVTVTLNEPAFTNLVANGDMEGDVNNWKAASSVTGAVISLVEDSADASNHVLRYDGTNITAGKISYVAYSGILTEGKSYYYAYKIRKAECDTNEGNLYAYNKNHTAHTDLARPMLSTEWVSRAGVFTAKDTSYNFKVTSSQEDSNTNVADVIYELDDVVIYDLSYIHEFYVPSGITMIQNAGVKMLPATITATQTTTKYFAEEGAEVKFTYSGNKGLKADVEMTADGDTYTFIMPEYEVTVSEVSSISFDIIDQIPNITVAKPQSFVVIAAKYNSEGMAEVYIADIVTEEDNQVVTFKNIPEFSTISDWTGMKLFVWNNFEDLKPLCETFVCEPQA